MRRDQLFFIAFGRIWAENIKPAALVQRVRTDPHSPAQFRVDGTLHNVPEFAKAFNCSPKAKVRCSVEITECPSRHFFSLTLPRRNDAFSGRDPGRIRITRTLIIYYLSPWAAIGIRGECVGPQLPCESNVLAGLLNAIVRP